MDIISLETTNLVWKYNQELEKIGTATYQRCRKLYKEFFEANKITIVKWNNYSKEVPHIDYINDVRLIEDKELIRVQIVGENCWGGECEECCFDFPVDYLWSDWEESFKSKLQSDFDMEFKAKEHSMAIDKRNKELAELQQFEILKAKYEGK